MKRIGGCCGLALLAAALCVLTASSQPPDGKGPGQKGGPRGGFGGGPPPYELGRLFPPFIRGELNLTPDQERQLQSLEAEVKERLQKILTEKQIQQLKEMRPGGPGGFGGKGPGGKGPSGKGPGGGPSGGKGPGGGPPGGKGPSGQARTPNQGGIQWFATWESGRVEAARTGRPILLVSAAPHCAGVSGVW